MKRTLLLVAVVLFSAVPVAAQDVAPATITRFEATCQVRGARLEWDVSSHVGVTRFDLYHDGVFIGTVQATCPNCAAGGSYAFVYVTQTPNGAYRLWHDTGEAWATLTDCQPEPPTAVTLASFEARKPGGCHCKDGWYQCRIGGGWKPLWRCK